MMTVEAPFALDYNALPSGRELDCTVARALGYRVWWEHDYPIAGEWWCARTLAEAAVRVYGEPRNPNRAGSIPAYSTDIAACEEVKQWLVAQGACLTISHMPPDDVKAYRVLTDATRWDPDYRYSIMLWNYVAEGETEALAVCRVALWVADRLREDR